MFASLRSAKFRMVLNIVELCCLVLNLFVSVQLIQFALSLSPNHMELSYAVLC